MERKKSFTGRQRRLTNRWGVKFADAVAKGLITIGGIGTIAAVLMVFVFLAYVAFPLLLPTTVSAGRISTFPQQGVPLLVHVDENRLLTWQLFPDARWQVSQLDSGSIISDATLFDAASIKSAATYPWRLDDGSARDEFAIGLADGSIILGSATEKSEFRRDDELPETIVALATGQLAAYDGGVIAKTERGKYRWQTIAVETKPPQKIAEAPLIDIDFQRSSNADLSVATLTESGEVVVAEVTESTNILTDETTQESVLQTVPLPSWPPERPWRVFLMGRANQLLVLWKSGHAARYRLAGGDAVLEEEVSLLDEGELTAAMLLQGRYTLLIGDSNGRLSAWFTAAKRVGLSEQVQLIKAHDLPSLSGPITALARSNNLRLIAAGSEQGDVDLFFVTSPRRLTHTTAFAGQPIERLVFSPNDDVLLAISSHEQWIASVTPRHPEASWPSLFRPVWYEGYDRPLNKWQSSAGSQEPEPKFGLIPLIFGTIKATVYSMLFGAPLALLAAVYSSEFVDPKVKSPLKSMIELMASVPSVVLGFLAGLVLAPFVSDLLATLLAAIFCLPFLFLLGAHLWQLLPQKAVIRLARYRLLAIAAMFLLGIAASVEVGPAVEKLLFAGDFKGWLAGRTGGGTSGWFLLLLPLAGVAVTLATNAYLNPWLRLKSTALPRATFAVVNLGKFLLCTLTTLVVAYVVGTLITAAGFDPRGGVVDAYVQRNALVVGFVMGFAIIPIIYTISDDALATVPQHLRSASLGCGATPWQTTWRVVVPTAASGLFSAVMIGMGRAVGETMIMLMATGNVPIMDLNIFNGFRTLSANLAEEVADASPWSSHFRILFLTGLVLLVITFFINTAAEAIRISFRRRASQL